MVTNGMPAWIDWSRVGPDRVTAVAAQLEFHLRSLVECEHALIATSDVEAQLSLDDRLDAALALLRRLAMPVVRTAA